MKRKILSLVIILLLVSLSVILTGCGKGSDYISEIKNMHFECAGSWYNDYKSITENYTVGELMESQLQNATWKEEIVDRQECVFQLKGQILIMEKHIK